MTTFAFLLCLTGIASAAAPDDPLLIPVIKGSLNDGPALSVVHIHPPEATETELPEQSAQPLPGWCGLQQSSDIAVPFDGSASLVSRMRTSKASLLKRRQLELVLVATGDFTAGRSDESVVDEIAALVRGANRFYEPLGVELHLAGVQLIPASAADPYGEAVRESNSWKMLDVVRREWSGRGLPAHQLVGVLAQSSFRGTIGLAFTATTCLDRSNGFFFATRAGGDQLASRNLAATIAHEIGHALGMSHDGMFYSNGPSIMWPLAVSNSNGFSSRSQEELQMFAIQGGVDCLADLGEANDPDRVSSIDGTLIFTGGKVQRFAVAEGDTFRYVPQLATFEPGASFDASGLPEDASFDARSGAFVWTPSFDVVPARNAKATFSFDFRAQTYSGAGAVTVILDVVNRNRPPEIVGIESEAVELARGESVVLAVQGVDDDRGDSVSLSGALNRPRTGFNGSIRCRSSRCDLVLRAVGVPGQRAVAVFAAKDRNGAVARVQVLVTIVAPNLPPAIGVTITSSGESGVFETTVAVSDPEGGLRAAAVESAVPGLIEEWDGKRFNLQVVQSDESKSDQITIGADDGKRKVTSVVTVPVLPKGGALSYPRALSTVSSYAATNAYLTFDPAQARWREFECDGSLREEAVFGRAGDHPLRVRRGGELRRAVYRVVNEQGYFVVEPESDGIPWGLAEDVPLSGDLDGDSRGDLIVFRQRTSEWWIRLGDGRMFRREATAVPAPGGMRIPFVADLDGDGRDELILFSQTENHLGVFTAELGSGADPAVRPDKRIRFYLARGAAGEPMIPYVADLDGDGRADLGLRTGLGVRWEIYSSSGQIARFNAGEGLSSSGVGSCGGRADQLFVANRVTGDAVAFERSGESMAFRPMRAPEGPRMSLLDLHVQRSRALFKPSVGDTDGMARGARAVLRTDGQSRRWLQQLPGGVVRSYAPIPQRFSYRGFGAFRQSVGGSLYSFVDGLWLLQNADGISEAVQWGVRGDVPVPGDYDGNGRDELAVFRPTDGSWWIYFRKPDGSGERGNSLSWGEAEDVPVPADYDGDGRTDLAIARRCPGGCGWQWFIRHADETVRVERFGDEDSMLVPGDYLGLGFAQLAVWSESTGEWTLKIPGGPSVGPFQWGLPGDVPVKSQLQGGGVQQLTVFRPANGTWYSKLLSDGSTQAQQFGLPADDPLSSYRIFRLF